MATARSGSWPLLDVGVAFVTAGGGCASTRPPRVWALVAAYLWNGAEPGGQQETEGLERARIFPNQSMIHAH